VDHARTRHREKRGGGAATLVLNEALDLPHNRPYELIALDDALTALGAARSPAEQDRRTSLFYRLVDR